jgi:hypothetical protein
MRSRVICHGRPFVRTNGPSPKVGASRIIGVVPFEGVGPRIGTREGGAAMSDEPELKQGAEGEWVTYLQQWLNHLGYYEGAVDGQFGPVTQEAVNTAQGQYGIGDNGAVGDETWHLITIARTKDETKADVVWGDYQIDEIPVPEVTA